MSRPSLSRVLSDAEERLLADERALLATIRVALERAGIEKQDADSLDASIRQLDELF